MALQPAHLAWKWRSVGRTDAGEQKTWLPDSTPLTWPVVQQDLLRRAVYGRQKRCYIVPTSQMTRERCWLLVAHRSTRHIDFSLSLVRLNNSKVWNAIRWSWRWTSGVYCTWHIMTGKNGRGGLCITTYFATWSEADSASDCTTPALPIQCAGTNFPWPRTPYLRNFPSRDHSDYQRVG